MVAARPSLTWLDAVKVSKNAIRNLFRDIIPQRYTASEVQSLETAGLKTLIVDGATYVLDATDATSAHDGLRVLVSADGERYKLASVRVVDELVTINVPADFADIQEAIDAFNLFRFSGDGGGEVVIADGQYSQSSGLRTRHSQPGTIALRAATPAASVATSDITNGQSSNQTMLRSKYAVEIICGGNGIELRDGEAFSVVQDILFTATLALRGANILKGANLSATRCAFHLFGRGIFASGLATVNLTDCQIVDSGSTGVQGLNKAFTESIRTIYANTGIQHVYTAFGSVCYSFQDKFGDHNAGTLAYIANNSSAYLSTADAFGTVGSKTWQSVLGSITQEVGTHTGGVAFGPAVGTSSADGSYTA